ncbi:uncharacterized protein L203_101265 [Cryptococcus depauperatus CBS 7841]|uniref:Uncharacterized protein n=1 Tax=Cryptococcus depauperatus CBS 7841 TaxID=1295531 RepID=A0AAJ8JPM4_9TREE
MEYLAEFRSTSTISVNPPGGTNTGHPGQHPSHLPLPTNVFQLQKYYTQVMLGKTLSGSLQEEPTFPWHVGVVPIYHPPHHSDPLTHLYRQVFTIRYVDAAFTGPLIIVALTRLAGVSPATSLCVALAELVVVYSGWAGSVSGGWPWSKHGNGSAMKWAWFAVGILAFIALWSVLFVQGRKAAVYRLRSTQGLFYLLSAMVMFIHVGLGVVWILTEGLNLISVNAEIITYGIMDIALKIGFTHLLLLLHKADEIGPWTLPSWWAEDPEGDGLDGRGIYGAVASTGSD